MTLSFSDDDDGDDDDDKRLFEMNISCLLLHRPPL